MIQWLHKTQLYKVKPVDSAPCRITKCKLNHNRVDLLKVLPAKQTNKQLKTKIIIYIYKYKLCKLNIKGTSIDTNLFESVVYHKTQEIHQPINTKEMLLVFG